LKKWLIKECNVIGLVSEKLSLFKEKNSQDFLNKFLIENAQIIECPVFLN